jgi:hypothetical protein
VLFSKIWKEWRDALIVVKPETVILWHKKGSSYFGNSNPEKGMFLWFPRNVFGIPRLLKIRNSAFS